MCYNCSLLTFLDALATYFIQNVCWQNCRYWTPNFECSEQIFFSPGKRRSKVKVPVMWYRKHTMMQCGLEHLLSLWFFAKLTATLKQVTNVANITSSVWHVKCIGCLVNLFKTRIYANFIHVKSAFESVVSLEPGSSSICDIEYAGMSAGQNSTDCNNVEPLCELCVNKTRSQYKP